MPVIVSDAVGCADDLVRQGVTGFVVRSHEPQALASAMSRIAREVSVAFLSEHYDHKRFRERPTIFKGENSGDRDKAYNDAAKVNGVKAVNNQIKVGS